VTTQESRIFYAFWVGLWTRCLSRSVTHLRWSTLSLGAGVLLVFFMMGRGLQGPSLGLLCVLLVLANPVFWAASCVTQEHMALLLGATSIMALAVGTPAFRWKKFILGVLMGLSTGFHPNMAVFFMGMAVFYPCLFPDERPLSAIVLLTCGFLAGTLLALAPVDLTRYLQFQNTLYWQFAKPPILSKPWTPMTWIQSTLMTCFRGPTYYFDSTVSGWRQSLGVYWAAAGLSLVGLVGRKSRASRALGLGLLMTFVGLALLVKRQEMVYGLIVLPFLIPLMGLGWEAHPRSARIVSVLIFIAGLGCFGIFAHRYARRGKSFEQVRREIQVLAPEENLKIAGPNFLWLMYPNRPIRDIGAMINSRYYTGGESDLGGWLGQWQPDVLFVSPLFKRIFLGAGPGEPALRRILGASSVHLLGTVIAMDPYGPFEVYRIEWPKK